MCLFCHILHRLLRKLERQKEIIHEYKITLTHSRHAEDECEKELYECKENENRKYNELIICESNKFQKNKENSKLKVEKYISKYKI